MERTKQERKRMTGQEASRVIYDEFKSRSKVTTAEMQKGDRAGEFGCFLRSEWRKDTAINHLRRYPNAHIEYSYVQTQEEERDYIHVCDWHEITSTRDQDSGDLEKMTFGWVTARDLPRESRTG